MAATSTRLKEQKTGVCRYLPRHLQNRSGLGASFGSEPGSGLGAQSPHWAPGDAGRKTNFGLQGGSYKGGQGGL